MKKSRLGCLIASLSALFICALNLVTPSYGASGRTSVKVGFFPFGGYHIVDGEGNKSGYGYEYLQHMRVYSNWDYQYVGYEDNKTWSDMLTMLKAGDIDLLTSAVKTTEREADFDFSDNSIGTSSTILTVKAGNTSYTSENMSSWKDIKVGLLMGNSRNDSFASYATEKGFSYIPNYYSTESELTLSLASGAIDAIVTSNLRQIKNEWILSEFDPKPFYVIVKKGNQTLLDQVNYAIEQIDTAEPNLKEELFRKYYSPDNGDEISFTEEERSFIESCKTNDTVFQAAIDPEMEPYSYVEDGQVKGITADIGKEIFKRTSLNINYKIPSSRQAYLDLKEKANIDICADFCSDSSHAENSGYILTDSYYSASIALLKRKDFSGEIASLGVLPDDPIQDSMQSLFTGKKTVEYPSVSAMAEAVKASKIDACYLFNSTAQSLANSDETNHIISSTMPTESFAFSLGVNSADSYLLVSILNKACLSLSQSDVTDLAAPYAVTSEGQKTFTAFFYEYPYVVLSIFGAILLLLSAVCIIMIMHKKQDAEKKMNQALVSSSAQAEEANRSKTEFLYRISHDIRTPINIISGMTAFAYEDVKDEKKLRNDLNEIQNANAFLLSLINDVLDVSQIDSGKIELKPETYSCAQFSLNISNLFTPLCKEKGLNFKTEISGENYLFAADKVRLNQIAMNLLSNAVKYTPQGGQIFFRLHGEKTEVAARIKLIMEVEDNGIGMSDKFQKTMYDAFSQETGNPNRPKTSTGTGLGLSIVKRLINVMDGQIQVKSELGKGTKFTCSFFFPFEGIEEEKENKSIPEQKEDIDLSSAPKLSGKLLLAEDNDMNAQIAVRLLTSFGFEVIRAENGYKAVTDFKLSKVHEYKAIIMDIQMPRMNGYDATKAIRMMEREDAKTIPIFAMTADAFAEDVKKAEEAGMNGHIAKPIDPKALYKTLRNL